MSTSSRNRNPVARRAWQAPALATLPVRATANRGAGAYVDTFTIGERPPWGPSVQAPCPPEAGGPLPCETRPTRHYGAGRRPWQAPAVTALPLA